jgi:hypothetical protein
MGFVGLQLYREGKLYSKFLILFHHHQSIVSYHVEHIISMHWLSRLVTISEESNVEPNPEGVPSFEVGFDICGTHPEPEISVDQGKPRMHLNPTLWFTNFISLLAYEILH